MRSIVRRTIHCDGHIIDTVGETVRSRIGSRAGAASSGTAAKRNLSGTGDGGAVCGGLLQTFLVAQIAHVNSKACRQDEQRETHGSQDECLPGLLASNQV